MVYQFFQRIPRYSLVAAFCALLHNAILIAGDAAGLHYIACQTVSAAVLLPTGYLLLSRWVFVSPPTWSGFVRYSTVLMTNFPVAIASLWLLRDLLAMPMIAAAPLSTALLFLWNYLTSLWAFWPTIRVPEHEAAR